MNATWGWIDSRSRPLAFRDTIADHSHGGNIQLFLRADAVCRYLASLHGYKDVIFYSYITRKLSAEIYLLYPLVAPQFVSRSDPFSLMYLNSTRFTLSMLSLMIFVILPPPEGLSLYSTM